MLQQALRFNLPVFNLLGFDIRINALVLISLFLITLLFHKKNKYIMLVNITLYIILIMATTNIFNDTQTNDVLIDFRLTSYPFFWYALFHFGYRAFLMFSFSYAFASVLIFSFFPFIIKKVRYFIFCLLFIFLLAIILNILDLNNRTLLIVDFLFYLTGYGLGVFIKNFKKAIDYLENF
jgi:hypothetical protein